LYTVILNSKEPLNNRELLGFQSTALPHPQCNKSTKRKYIAIPGAGGVRRYRLTSPALQYLYFLLPERNNQDSPKTEPQLFLKKNIFFFGSAEFLFHGYEIQDAGTNEAGDMILSPIAPLRHSHPGHDDCRRRPPGATVADWYAKFKKNVPAPPCLYRGPEAGVNRVKKIFMDWVRALISSTFLQSIFLKTEYFSQIL
jgi:hypothetical protein